MHRFFYHNFHIASMQDWMAALLVSFAVGSLAGCLACMKMPVPGLYEICSGVLRGQTGVSSQVLCCLLPLTLAGVLAYFSRCTWYLLIPSALCGFLFSFSVCAFVCALHSAGWVFSALLLAGRGLCLAFLFWFLLRRIQMGQVGLSRDLALACCFSVLCILVLNWLLSPVVAELSQSFIST